MRNARTNSEDGEASRAVEKVGTCTRKNGEDDTDEMVPVMPSRPSQNTTTTRVVESKKPPQKVYSPALSLSCKGSQTSKDEKPVPSPTTRVHSVGSATAHMGIHQVSCIAPASTKFASVEEEKSQPLPSSSKEHDCGPEDDKNNRTISSDKDPQPSSVSSRRPRRIPGQNAAPGAYHQGGAFSTDVENDGTIVIGDSNTGIEQSGNLTALVNEPLDATLVEEQRRKPHLVDGIPIPTRRRYWLLVGGGCMLLLIALGITLGVTIRACCDSEPPVQQANNTTRFFNEWHSREPDLLGDAEDDAYGWTVAISRDGSTLAAGAYPADLNALAYIRVFSLASQGRWRQIGSSIQGSRGLGKILALSADGRILAVSAIFERWVRVYRLEDDQWQPMGDDIVASEPEDDFGWSLALSDDGKTLAVGAIQFSNQGSGYVSIYQFGELSDRWILQDRLEGESPGDVFGFWLGFSGSANRLAIGSPGNSNVHGDTAGRVLVFEKITDEWVPVGDPLLGNGEMDAFGWSVALDAQGDCVAAGGVQQIAAGVEVEEERRPGYLKVFCWDQQGQWILRGGVLAGHDSDDSFGFSVDLSSDGRTLAVGATGNGGGYIAIYRYERDNWIPMHRVNGARDGDDLGRSVALSGAGSIVATGAPYHDANGQSNSGQVRILREFACEQDESAEEQALPICTPHE